MCGFLGVIWNGEVKLDESIFLQMLRTQLHRGPDQQNIILNENIWVGHNRLSIVDTTGSKQPMIDETKKHILVFNGEIYNYQELALYLKQKGIFCDRKSDTSVLLHGYIAEGQNFLNKINGMFSFVIYNKVENSIELVRDRLGKKPLFYALVDGGLIFSSNIKGIIESGLISTNLSCVAVLNFLKYGFIPEETCIYSEIIKVKSAERVFFKDGVIEKTIYWTLAVDDKVKCTNKLNKEITDLIKSAIELRFKQSDVEVGTFLSGGLDSSGIASIVASFQRDKNTRAFHIVPNGNEYDESVWAKLVAQKQKITLEIEKLEEFDTMATIDQVIPFFDEPFADASALPTHQVCSLAAKSLKVTLSGEGGDELFNGYPWQIKFMQTQPVRSLFQTLGLSRTKPFPFVYSNFKKLKVLMNLIFLRNDKAYEFLFSGGMSEVILPLLNNKFIKDFENINSVSNNFNKICGDDFQKMMFSDLKHYLNGDLLVKMDSMSMANSLEVRSPLLDYRLIELLFQISPKLRQRKKRKKLLRKAFSDFLPDVVVKRRDKRGFSIDKKKRLNDINLNLFYSVIQSEDNELRKILNFTNLKKLISKKFLNSFEYDLIWNLIILQKWLKNNGKS